MGKEDVSIKDIQSIIKGLKSIIEGANVLLDSLTELIPERLSEVSSPRQESKSSSNEDVPSRKEETIKVGSEVKWTDEDYREMEGKVIKIKGDIATVEDEDDDEYKVDLDDLELVQEKSTAKKQPEEKTEIKVGSEVKWINDFDNDDYKGKVLKIKGNIATVEDEDENEYKVDLDELELIQ